MNLGKLERLIADKARAQAGASIEALREEFARALVPGDELRLAADSALGAARTVQPDREDPVPWY